MKGTFFSYLIFEKETDIGMGTQSFVEDKEGIQLIQVLYLGKTKSWIANEVTHEPAHFRNT